ncbi:MAG: DUF2950 domain-containing protein [Chitinophagaceae bacterium]|nr:DUF2950 domain-containing protein [Rubrivivax sp.]
MSVFQASIKRVRRLALPALLVVLPLAANAQEQRTFATPQAAVEALITALKMNDERALVAIVGDKHRNLVVTGDPANDAAQRAETAALLGSYHVLDDNGPDKSVLLMGPQAWPLPIPLVRQGGAWRFATEEGAEEILNRRIGGNERNAIAVLLAYVEAQREYASRDRDGDGVLQYARQIGSTAGKFDGLYWPADASKGEEASPFGPLIAQSAAYLAGRRQGDAYRGYHFRILTGQGRHAAGGAYSYLVNGRLLGGFAMVAYPDAYGQTGVTTFLVNQNGKVFEKDLGQGTEAIAAKMTTFDPVAGWKSAAQ